MIDSSKLGTANPRGATDKCPLRNECRCTWTLVLEKKVTEDILYRISGLLESYSRPTNRRSRLKVQLMLGEPLFYCVAAELSLATHSYVQFPCFRQQTCFVLCSLVALERV